MPTYLLVAQILVSAALIASVLFQLRGGGIGGIFGQADSVYRTRRGIESTLFKLTIVLVIVLVVLATLIAAQS
ncbi:preprotein translocase subunit SecG [Candidatus Magnetobacterium casense]|uniref:Protein-export membrane protein SecG n=1 Tax=Candidatus Magnetobacterium casense TaxID=1455061 RepID=A0ABS6S141_9BACT|nr:preprotein translocase subunit SecG [Candidatus Magnetobacterium casensis]MBV6342574.1 preprotein translocase subunit SecG [Candidatus Magnetobacterium casensis]